MEGGDHSNDHNLMIITSDIVPPVTYGIMLVGPAGRGSPRQPEHSHQQFSFYTTSRQGKESARNWNVEFLEFSIPVLFVECLLLTGDTDPCCLGRSSCATRMDGKAASSGPSRRCLLGSANRDYTSLSAPHNWV